MEVFASSSTGLALCLQHSPAATPYQCLLRTANRLHTEICERIRQLVADLVAYRRRHADAPWLGQGLKLHGGRNGISDNLVTVVNYIPQIYADK